MREVLAIYQEDMLIKTKFHIPFPGSSLVKRKRLLDKLTNNIYKVIIITAPAGYGKTSLLSSWVSANRKKQNMTWLMLDEEDNDAELFWSYFLQSFYRSL